jgi:hypothetical protein
MTLLPGPEIHTGAAMLAGVAGTSAFSSRTPKSGKDGNFLKTCTFLLTCLISGLQMLEGQVSTTFGTPNQIQIL